MIQAMRPARGPAWAAMTAGLLAGAVGATGAEGAMGAVGATGLLSCESGKKNIFFSKKILP